jgi:D-sedoheptulose 7-phosphate isomerase
VPPDSATNTDAIVAALMESRDVLSRALTDTAFLDSVARSAAIVTDALSRGNKIMLVGNGGSAADAQHIAAELVGRFQIERAALPGLALTTDTSALTAIANDYGYEQVFSRQVLGLGRRGDVLIALSTSGNSPNILAAGRAAKSLGIAVIGLTGEGGGSLAALCDAVVKVPSASTPLIQQVHITAGHIICSMAEQSLFESRS